MCTLVGWQFTITDFFTPKKKAYNYDLEFITILTIRLEFLFIILFVWPGRGSCGPVVRQSNEGETLEVFFQEIKAKTKVSSTCSASKDNTTAGCEVCRMKYFV